MSGNEGNSPPNMIYHYPLDLGPQISGSRVQMAQLLQGFQEIGYAVSPMIGLAETRAHAWAGIRVEAAGATLRLRLYAIAHCALTEGQA